MRICIVGHGPSLEGAGKGKEIDSHDRVVRLKGSNTVIDTDDFGRKVDALVASTEIMGTFFKMNAPEYWAYPKKGFYKQQTFLLNIEHLAKPVMIPIGVCNHWNNYFRTMNPCHPNYSTGMAAIIMAIHRWRPKEIVLAGFDTLVDPSVVFKRHSGIPRSGVGPLPGHDWQKENDLLKVLSNLYKVSIEPL